MAWKLCKITANEKQFKGYCKRQEDQMLLTIIPFTTEISVGDTIALHNDEYSVLKTTNTSNRSETLDVLMTRKVKQNGKYPNKGTKPAKRRSSD